MSLTYQEKVECPCGASFESELFQSISIHEDPDLRDKVMGGEVNVVQCPTCSQFVYAERFVLYHDKDEELMAFVYPKDTEPNREEIQKEMGRAFAELQAGLPPENKIHYQPFLVFGMDQLCELLRLEEERYDEAAVVEVLCQSLELLKKTLSRDAARRLGIPTILPLSARPRSEKDAAEVRELLIKGLKTVLESNGHLEHYKKLLARVESDPGWGARAG